jgi:hypothetical protein
VEVRRRRGHALAAEVEFRFVERFDDARKLLESAAECVRSAGASKPRCRPIDTHERVVVRRFRAL